MDNIKIIITLMACLQEMFYYSTCTCEIEGERWDDLCPCQACVDLPIAALPRLNVANWYFHLSSIYHVSPCYQMICPPATHGCYLSSKFSSNLILTTDVLFRRGQAAAIFLKLRITLRRRGLSYIIYSYRQDQISRQESDLFFKRLHPCAANSLGVGDNIQA